MRVNFKYLKIKEFIFFIFLILFLNLCFTYYSPCYFVHAAEKSTNKQKVIKNYKKFLKKANISWGNNENVPLDKCYFALVYVNNDNIPELLLCTKDYGSTSHATGYGAIYSFSKNKVKMISNLAFEKREFKYYKKKSLYIDTYSRNGNFYQNYYLYPHKAIGYTLNRSASTGEGVLYRDANYNDLKKEDFEKLIKSYSNNTKSTKAKFRKNNEKNRKKYLK